MELTIALSISILSIVFTIINFANGRKDKATKEAKEDASKQSVIEYRLNELEKKIDQVLGLLDKQESEFEGKIEKALENHIKQYHEKHEN